MGTEYIVEHLPRREYSDRIRGAYIKLVLFHLSSSDIVAWTTQRPVAFLFASISDGDRLEPVFLKGFTLVHSSHFYQPIFSSFSLCYFFLASFFNQMPQKSINTYTHFIPLYWFFLAAYNIGLHSVKKKNFLV